MINSEDLPPLKKKKGLKPVELQDEEEEDNEESMDDGGEEDDDKVIERLLNQYKEQNLTRLPKVFTT